MSVESVRVAKAVLECIVEQLESIGEQLSFAPSGFVDPATGLIDAETRRRSAAGMLDLRRALLNARRALASADPDVIVVAALECSTLYGNGRMAAAPIHKDTARRHKGGDVTGAKQKTAAAERYAPYLPRFQRLVAEGKSKATAREIIRKELMNRQEKPIVVSTRTLQKYLL